MPRAGTWDVSPHAHVGARTARTAWCAPACTPLPTYLYTHTCYSFSYTREGVLLRCELRGELESAVADAIDDADEVLGGALYTREGALYSTSAGYDAAAIRRLMDGMLDSDDVSTDVQPPQPHTTTDGIMQDAPTSVQMNGSARTADEADMQEESLCSNFVTMLTQMLKTIRPSRRQM